VRYIGNRSTGKMGVAIAEAALARGAAVTLICGMTSVPLPEQATVVSAPSASQMREAVLASVREADALIMAAAVADFRPRHVAESKIARDGSGLTLELEPTSDILAEAVQLARQSARRPVIVGFAAETGSLERARAKAERKGVDLLVANDVAEEGSGFGTSTNRVTLVVPGGRDEEWPLMSKRQVADKLLDRVVRVRAGAELAIT
jgi:phosphopantothenoylcysteine decarboxylase/phosphopantothenate--cysteine ligase